MGAVAELLSRSEPIGSTFAQLLRLTEQRGVRRADTLPAISCCRDELVADLHSVVEATWGRPFLLGGFGGVPAVGPIGFSTALSHVPVSQGRGAFLIIGASHLGVLGNDVIGESLRKGQREPTGTCGALIAVTDSLHAGAEAPPFGEHELDSLWRLVRSLYPDEVPDLASASEALTKQIDTDIHRSLAAINAHQRHDLIVATGTILHHHETRFIPYRSTFIGESGQPETL
jgi:hypothetical protein